MQGIGGKNRGWKKIKEKGFSGCRNWGRNP